MAQLATINPLNQFFALNGTPLNNGKLYFGSINTDPEQNPVQMYWDSAGLVPALQPIRTTSGYPSRSGSPAILYCASRYSLRVRQSNDVQVFYIPEAGSEPAEEFDVFSPTGLTPSFVSANSFTVTGDQTAVLPPQIRVRASVTAGTVYGTVASAVFGALTTVTLTMDAGDALDAGLSSIAVGFSPDDSPIPTTYAKSGANTDITSLGNNTSTIYTTGGTSTAYTITPAPVYTAYAAGMSAMVNFNAASGASPTIAWNGVATPPNLVKENPDGTYSNIRANDIPINHRSRVTLLSATQALVENMPRARSMVRLNTSNGYGSTNTRIMRFVNTVQNIGPDITYTDSGTDGASFTVNSDGVYSISYFDNFNGARFMGLSLNSSELTTNIESITLSAVLGYVLTTGASEPSGVSTTVYLTAGSVIRAHTDAGVAGTASRTFFTMTRVD